MLVHLSPHCSTLSPKLRSQSSTGYASAPLVRIALDRIAQRLVRGPHRPETLLASWPHDVRMRDADESSPRRPEEALKLGLRQGLRVEMQQAVECRDRANGVDTAAEGPGQVGRNDRCLCAPGMRLCALVGRDAIRQRRLRQDDGPQAWLRAVERSEQQLSERGRQQLPAEATT